jgi:hypothetical protein
MGNKASKPSESESESESKSEPQNDIASSSAIRIAYAQVTNEAGEFLALASCGIDILQVTNTNHFHSQFPLTPTLTAQAHRVGLTCLLPALTQLTSLTSMDVSANNLIELPTCMQRLSSLTQLDCGFNEMRDLPPLPPLSRLSAPGNLFGVVPQSALALTRLLHLDLSHCELLHLPDEFGVTLSRLEHLNLAGNELCTLPESLVHCAASLVSLDVAGNRLRSLPAAMGVMHTLQALRLQRNHLTTLVALTPLASAGGCLTELVLRERGAGNSDNQLPPVRGLSYVNKADCARRLADIVLACLARDDAAQRDDDSDDSGDNDGDDDRAEPSRANKLRRVQQAQADHTCCVCADGSIGVALMPCAHLCVCGDCAATLAACPICRVDVTDRIRIFLA